MTLKRFGLPEKFVFAWQDHQYICDFTHPQGGLPYMIEIDGAGNKIGKPFFCNTVDYIAETIRSGSWKLLYELTDAPAVPVEDLL